MGLSKLPRASRPRRKRCKKYFSADVVNLFIFSSFSNTPHVFFQVAAFYQIWQAYFFRDTSSQMPDLCNPIDISPLCSPTFIVLKEKLFSICIIHYFTEANRITLFADCYEFDLLKTELELISINTNGAPNSNCFERILPKTAAWEPSSWFPCCCFYLEIRDYRTTIRYSRIPIQIFMRASNACS